MSTTETLHAGESARSQADRAPARMTGPRQTARFLSRAIRMINPPERSAPSASTGPDSLSSPANDPVWA